jgi:hypothetical protein
MEKVDKGAIQQFSKKLHCIPDMQRIEDGGSRLGEGRNPPFWRSGGSDNRGSFGGSGSGSGSEAPSWRKEDDQGGEEVGRRRRKARRKSRAL